MALIVVFRPQAVDAYPRSALLYYPIHPTAEDAPGSIFEAGEVAEFQQKDFAKATAIFREADLSRKIDSGRPVDFSQCQDRTDPKYPQEDRGSVPLGCRSNHLDDRCTVVV
jgi:hypothetical protein